MNALAIAIGMSGVLGAACAGQVPPPFVLSCAAPSFADGIEPVSVRHVAPAGDDRAGDGSELRPYRTLTRAAQAVTPGTAIRLHAGTYTGGNAVANARGTAAAPIWIEGAPGEPRPVLTGGNQALYMTRVSHIVVRRLEIAGTADNGINVDDGERMDDEDATRYVLFDDLDVHDTGQRTSAVPDCLKLAGVNDFVIRNSTFSRCGRAENGAVGVNGVGAHRGVVSGNRFRENGFGGIQFKGASSDIAIVGNDLRDTGERGINMGGATGGRFFRPPLSAAAGNFEAARIDVSGNVFVGSEAAAAFVGCVDCRFSRNTVVDPGGWALRILQETVSVDGRTFSPALNGRIEGNLFIFTRSALNRGEDINVGRGTATETFALAGNLWHARDLPRESSPKLPSFRGAVTRNREGQPPQFADPAQPYRVGPGDTVGAPVCR